LIEYKKKKKDYSMNIRKIVVAGIALFLIGCGGGSGDGDGGSGGAEGGGGAESGSPVKLEKSGNIDQSTHYSVEYNGGTDLRFFTVLGSANKNCFVHELDSSYAYNPISSTPYEYSESDRRDGLYRFSVSWKYQTEDGGHFDFYVTCADIPDKVSVLDKFSITAPYHKELKKDLFFESGKLDNPDSNTRTITLSTNKWDYSKSTWSGFSALVGGVMLLNSKDHDYDPSKIGSAKLTYTKDNNRAVLVLRDKEGNVLAEDETYEGAHDSDGDISLKTFIGSIESDEVLHYYTWYLKTVTLH